MDISDSISLSRPPLAVAMAIVVLTVAVAFPAFQGFRDAFVLDADFSRTLFRPWTLLTYTLVHATPAHLIFNMMALLWCGYLFQGVVTGRNFLLLYLSGAAVGGLVWLLAEAFPVSAATTLMGASAGILALLGRIFLEKVRTSRDDRLSLVLIALAIAFTIYGGDPLPHAGGLLTGLFAALFLRKVVVNPDRSGLLRKVARSGYSCLSETEKSQLRISNRKHSGR